MTPFLIISKIGYPSPFSLRRRKASLTIDRLQQGEPSLFGSSSTQCQCGILPFLVPIRVTLFTGRPHGSMKKVDLVLYCGGLFPTEARKPPLCPLVKPKMDLYCRGFSLSETSQRCSSSWLVLPSISSSYHTRRSACSKIGPCGCPGSSNLLAARSTISSIRRFRSPFY